MVRAYRKTFFTNKKNVGLSTARAGNVIGGGDWSLNRLIPDCVRSLLKDKVNRANVTRRDDDVTNDVSIGLLDHDEAIAYYFDNVIEPSIVKNGQRVTVPLIYGSPERWKSVQRDGYYRDKEGKIQTPLIMFKRDSVDKRRDLGNKMDANNPQLQYVFQKK